MRAVRATAPERFGCISCGQCCRGVINIPGVFDEPIRPDGSCSHLTTDNLCDIYETRPKICRIDDYNLEAMQMTKQEWHDLNYDACETLISIGGRR